MSGWLRIAGLAGILGVAAVRSMVSVEPNVWFADVDPAREPMPLFALGAAKSHILDLVLFMSAALALFGEVRAGRDDRQAARQGVKISLVVLALLPVPIAVLHARTGIVAENGFRSDSWIAAILAFVALVHLVRDRVLRAAVLAVLLGLVGLLAVRGAVQVLVEHPATVAHFEQTRDEFFAARGWLPDSSVALSYERRLMQPEATGWFGLSNPFSTMMGVGALGFAALAILARRAQQSGNTLLLVLAACACAALLVVNGGKGAIGATLLAAAVLVVAQRRGKVPSPRWAIVFAVGMLALVGARWLVGTRISELSLLFRGYYIEAGLSILFNTDWFLIGCGPDRVQEFFNAAKPANCPEDVKSVHSIFFDWLVAFGVSGFAWIGLVAAVFWPMRVDGEVPSTPEADGARERRFAILFAFLVAVGFGLSGMLLASMVENPIVDEYWVVTRLVGLFTFALLAPCAAQAALVISGATLRAIALVLGILVLVHAQIETVAWMPGSCVLALAFLACATDFDPRKPLDSARLPPSAGRFAIGGSNLVIVTLGFLAMGSMMLGLRQDFSRAARVESVARSLAPIASEPAREYDIRMEAARRLTANDYAWSRFELEAAVMQALTAARVAGGPDARPGTPIGERELAAIELAEKTAWKRQLRGPRSDALRADVALAILRRADDERWSAFALLRVVENGAEALPNIPRRWMAVGEARKIVRDRLADKGLNSMATEIRDPREAFERAVVVNAQLSLDPLAQLSPRELAALEAALEAAPEADPEAALGEKPSSDSFDPQR